MDQEIKNNNDEISNDSDEKEEMEKDKQEKEEKEQKEEKEEKEEKQEKEQKEEINIQKDILTKKEEKEEEDIENEIPEDIDIQEDEYQKISLGGADSSDKMEKHYSKNKKQNRNKSKAKKTNKKPFIITVEDSSIKKIKIVFNACSFKDEFLMPIWCPKNSYIKFKVKGKWRIDKLYPYTDSKGLPSNNKGGFGYGTLIGRIGKGDDFVIYNDKVVIVKKEGPLYAKQLLPKNMKIEPEGSIEVIIYDGEYMDIDEINGKIGWIENNIENGNKNKQNEIIEDNGTKIKKDENMKKEFENKIRNEINNLRMNPLIFYDQFIRKTKKLTETRKYLELIKNEYKGVLNFNEEYYNAISSYFEFYKQNTSKKNVNQNDISNYLLELEGEIEYFLIDKFEMKTKVKCRLTQKTNPKDIIIQCFYDKKYRFYIFNKKSRDLTVNVINNFYKNFNLIIMAFTLEPPSEIVFK